MSSDATMIAKAQMRELLLEIYNLEGPRTNGGEVVPVAEFAVMSDQEVNRWDFERRFLMQRIAQAIAG